MRGIYTLKVILNKVVRYFKFGYIPGKNIISVRASIEKYLTLTLGQRAEIGPYTRLTCRGKGSIEIGDDTHIDYFVIMETRRNGFIKIGKESSIHAFTVIYGAGGVTIGNNTRIAIHTVIMASNHNFDDPTVDIYKQGISKKGIHIGNDVWIGAGARILDGVHIGDHSVIGAGSVVTKDIPENSIAMGVPARVVRRRGEKRT